MISMRHGGTQGGSRRVIEMTRQGPRPRLVGSALSIRRTETRAERTLDASTSQPSAEVRGMLFPPGRSPQGRVPAAGGALAVATPHFLSVTSIVALLGVVTSLSTQITGNKKPRSGLLAG